MTFGEYTKEDGKRLLELARKSLEEEFGKSHPELPKEKQFKQARGVFVTLTKNKELRGCIGFPLPIYSVLEAVYLAVKEAGFSDPRFQALEEKDLDKIKVEISILTLPEEVKDTKEIEVGKDGLICSYLGYSGLLLPQVAVEHHWDRVKFLETLCSKAGLPKDNWQNKNFKIKKFQCQSFKEE